MFNHGDKVRRIVSREAIDLDFEGPTRQHGKKIGSIVRVYEDLGADVCDIEYADGTVDTAVSLEEVEPAEANIES